MKKGRGIENLSEDSTEKHRNIQKQLPEYLQKWLALLENIPIKTPVQKSPTA